jgi:hypothetical protein
MKNFDEIIRNLFQNDNETFPNATSNWEKLNSRLDNHYNNNWSYRTKSLIKNHLWKSAVLILLLSNFGLWYKLTSNNAEKRVIETPNQQPKKDVNAIYAETKIKELESKIQEQTAQLSTLNTKLSKQLIQNSYQKSSNKSMNLKLSDTNELVASLNEKLSNYEGIKDENIGNNSSITQSQQNTVASINQIAPTQNDVETQMDRMTRVETLNYLPLANLTEINYEKLQLTRPNYTQFIEPISNKKFTIQPRLLVNASLSTGKYINDGDSKDIVGSGFGFEVLLNKYFGIEMGYENQKSVFESGRVVPKYFRNHLPAVQQIKPNPNAVEEFQSQHTDIKTVNYNVGLKFKFPNKIVTPSLSIGHNWNRLESTPVFVTYFDKNTNATFQEVQVANSLKQNGILYMSIGLEKSFKKVSVFTRGYYYTSTATVPNRIMLQGGLKLKLI